jgi:hypothetical protein
VIIVDPKDNKIAALDSNNPIYGTSNHRQFTRVDGRFVNRTVTINWAILAGSAPSRRFRGMPCQLSFRFSKPWVPADHRDGGGYPCADGFFAFLIMRAASRRCRRCSPTSLRRLVGDHQGLERQGIPYDIKNDGATLLIPKEQIPRLRMKLAEGGLPKGGGVGYEIFDKSDALGATSFVQNINHLRALEGELSRSIRAIDRVQQARVHLVLPERPLFSREKAEPRRRSCSRCAARWRRSRCARSAISSPARSTD